MKKLITIYLFFLAFIFPSYSQVAVISEYMNQSGTPDGEWTEILILENNVNLSDFVLRDNSDSGSWRPDTRFKKIPLWSNLQKGTIIVIMHRSTGTVLDVNPADGYIEVAASDPLYFDTPPNWDADGALSINQNNDMIQLLDASGNNVHTLGHTSSTSSNPYAVFQALSGPKLMYNGSLSNGSSLRVYPGATINDYEMGFDNSKKYTVANNSFSKGFPNANVGSTNTNHLFWRTLRQPEWYNPNANTTITNLGNSVKITWNPAATTMNSNEGYLILRIPANLRSAAQKPVDGKVYNKGEFLGSAQVVGEIYNLNKSEFIDNSFTDAECGQDYFYQIYAFRYNADDQGKDFLPENGRGRSYNEDDFAETSNVAKPTPSKPVISTLGGRTTFCEGEDITIELLGSYTADVTFQWYKDGTPIPGEIGTKLKVKQNGQYYLVVKNLTSLCENTSETVFIDILPAPKATLFIVEKDKSIQVTKDTIIYVCKDADPSYDYPRLNLQGASSNSVREWYFDGKLKNEETNKVETIAVQKGSYFGVIRNGICADSTPKVMIDYFSFDFRFTPSPAVFDADDSPIQTITIENRSNVDMTLLESYFTLPAGFSFVNTTFPILIPKNKTQQIQILYTRTTPGVDNGKLYLNLICSKFFKLDLQGVKKAPGTADLLSMPDTLNFGIITTCDAQNGFSKDISIKSIGTIISTIYNPILSGKINLQNGNFPINLSPDSVITFNFTCTETNPGIYSGNILIPFESFEKNPKKDTLQLPWELEIIQPKLDFNNILNVSIATCSDTAYQVLDVTNNTKLPITITNNFINSNYISILNTLPFTIAPNSKETIQLRIVSNSNFNLDDTLEYSPCDIKDVIHINAEKKNISITQENNEIDFGVVPACKNTSYENLITTNLDVEGGSAVVKSILFEGPFSTDLNVNDIITGKKNIKFIFQGNQLGNITGKVTITFDPCDYVVVYNIKAQGVEPTIVTDPDSIDYGVLPINTLTNKTFKIKNTSPFNIEISLTIDNKPEFSFNPSITNPVLLTPNEEKTFSVDFISSVENSKFQANISVAVNLCSTNISIPLTASTLSNIKMGTIVIDMPTEITGKIGETINLPIKIIPKDFELKDIDLQRIKYYFSYNGLLLYPKNAKPLNMNSWLNNSSVVLSENTMNTSLLDVTLNNQTYPTNNNWLDIDLQVLLLQSNITQSTLKLDSLILVSSAKISVENDSTIINVPKQCELENRNIVFDQTDQVPIIHNNNDLLDIKFKTIADGDVSITLINSFGEIVQTQTYENVRYGEYKTEIDLSKLQNGVYILEIKTPTGKFSKKIIILR